MSVIRMECEVGGAVMAVVEAPNLKAALAEITHYARQYADEGPATVYYKNNAGKRIKLFQVLGPQPAAVPAATPEEIMEAGK